MHNKSSKSGSERFWPTPTALIGGMYVEANADERNSIGLATAAHRSSIPTSSTSTEPTTPESTCSQVDFLANLSVSPGSDSARQMTVRSGRKCSALLARRDPLGSLVKMLLESSRWNSTISFLTWKASATPRGRLLFRLVPSMPDTDATESGLWPTPTALEFKDSGANWPLLAKLDRGGRVLRRIATRATEAERLVGGSLNPNWVEWLMGYPIGHTACAGWETRSSRKSPRKSSEQSPT